VRLAGICVATETHVNPAALLHDFGALHFLRPWWLCALVLLPVLWWWWHRRQREDSEWHVFVDPHLLPRLLESRGDRRSRVAPWIGALGYLLAVLALAGPSWRRSEQLLWQSQTPLIVALDLSSASLAADLPPSRLAQARAKLATLLRERKGGQIGLVAFAGDAFTVAPLTDDAANVALYLDALQPDVMPRDGQRASEAIEWSARLLKRAGARSGDIVVLSDHADDAAFNAASEAAAAGYRISALGLGTEAGTVYRRVDGSIASARLDSASLRKLAADGHGGYAELSGDDSDLRALGVLEPRTSDAAGGTGTGFTWRDEGYWLLPPLMLLALLAFRRRSGGAWVLVLLCAGFPLHSAHAQSAWQRPDQAEYTRIQRGNEAYRKGDFKAAAQEYEDADTATAHYNRGNALAKAGDYPQAIDAYNEALRRQPGMADAIANKRAVEAAMKRQKQSPSKPGAQQQKSQGQDGQSQPQSGEPSQSQKSDPANPQQQPSKQNAQQQQGEQQEPQNTHTQPQDAKAQQQADQAQRERMQRALEKTRKQNGKQPTQEAARAKETPEQRERRLANEAWLKRVPDDPGGLLRAKFRLEYERRVSQGRAEE
jgi:Ca-activated chloride channel homolog